MVTAPPLLRYTGCLCSRRLAAADRLPIRITFDTSAVAAATALTAAQRTLIVDNVLVDARSTLQGLLRVDRVVGNLFASRACLSAYSNGECCECCEYV
jgi:hypothetical protein